MRGSLYIFMVLLAVGCRKDQDCSTINNLTDQIIEFSEVDPSGYVGSYARHFIINDQVALDSFYSKTQSWPKKTYDFSQYTILAFKTDECLSNAFKIELKKDEDAQKYIYQYEHNCECAEIDKDDYFMFTVVKKLDPAYTVEMVHRM